MVPYLTLHPSQNKQTNTSNYFTFGCTFILLSRTLADTQLTTRQYYLPFICHVLLLIPLIYLPSDPHPPSFVHVSQFLPYLSYAHLHLVWFLVNCRLLIPPNRAMIKQIIHVLVVVMVVMCLFGCGLAGIRSLQFFLRPPESPKSTPIPHVPPRRFLHQRQYTSTSTNHSAT